FCPFSRKRRLGLLRRPTRNGSRRVVEKAQFKVGVSGRARGPSRGPAGTQRPGERMTVAKTRAESWPIAESTTPSYSYSTSTRYQHTHARQPLAARGVRQPCRKTAWLA